MGYKDGRAVRYITEEDLVTRHEDTLLCSGGSYNITLPAASAVRKSKRLVFVDVDAGGGITIVPDGSDTIGGAANYALSPNNMVFLYSNGVSNWDIGENL